MRRCKTCDEEIPQARLECIPDTETCVKHSTVKGYLGVLEFGHKTGGYVVKVDPSNEEGVRRMWRAYHRSR